MASSDDEFEALPHSVSDYHFEDENREPISFFILPLQWGEDEFSDGERREIFVSGFVDNGLQKIYKPVTTWKFSLSEEVPQISVLFKESNWIKLQKPRKGYEDEIKSILITIHSLHFLKKNPETSEKYLWDHLAKIFSAYDVRPSQDDLVDHMSLIGEAVKRDESLGKSKFLLSFLEEKPQKRNDFDKVVEISTKPAFIVDDDEIDDPENASDEEDDLFGSICAICDNGGELVCCDGQCMRSFHATKEAGAESECESLGFTNAAQVKAMQSFICKNCRYNQHQCFCCRKLGSSDKASGAEVFRCVNATCGLFYHPHCVAKVLYRDDEVVAEEIREKIAMGESFTCPIHKCIVCKRLEDKNVPELQFALCRRCPKSFHRKCLPREIAFKDIDDEDIIQRAWEDLMPKRILIYCLKHGIDEELGTPIRDHVKFPAIQDGRNKLVSKSLSGKEKVRSKQRSLDLEDMALEKISRKPSDLVEKPSSALTKVDSIKRNEKRSIHNSSNKIIVNDASVKALQGNTKSAGKKVEKSSTTDENGTSLGEKLFDLWCKGSEPSKPWRLDPPAVASDKAMTAKPVKGTLTSVIRLDADSERRILDLMKESTSSITLEDILKKHKVPSTHGSKNNVDKTITQGKIEGSVGAVRAAVQKLEKGCSIEDAKAVCEPEILQQMVRWKNKLKVYLAPFLHGMRYTSFGRHFTKVDKLKEIVDRLHWYIKNDDMIVDFCCGANDFSCLMKSKLEETGKKCSYKNYDVLQPKHDFNFEKRDWMTVKPKELPTGSKLIMGLNPPFGVKAALANQFINKALEFKPKLLILIVPPETERLDNKRSPYDLVWEDETKLSGKSFYLPGSVDANDKQMEQWNLTPPVLSLWSRPDWTNKHRAIGQKNGHLSRVQKESQLEGTQKKVQVLGLTSEDNCNLHGDASMVTVVLPMPINDPKPDSGGTFATGRKESSPCIIGGEAHGDHDHPESQPNGKSRKRRRGKKNHGEVESDTSVKDKPNDGEPIVHEMKRGRSHHPSANEADGRSSFERHQSESCEMSSHVGYGDESFRHFQPGMSASGSQFGRGYAGGGVDDNDDPARWYNLNSSEHCYSGTPRWPSGPATDGPGYRLYTSEDSDIRSQVRRYGQQDSASFTERSGYTIGHNPGFNHLSSLSSYGHLGSPAESSFSTMHTPAIHRYAPRLDELNHPRINTPGPELPMGTGSGSSYYDPLAPSPRFRADSMGFAPSGPRHPFSYHR